MPDAEEPLTERRPTAATADAGSSAEDEETAEDGDTADGEETVEGGMTADSGEETEGEETVDTRVRPSAAREPSAPSGAARGRGSPHPAALAAPTARTRGGGAWRSTWTPTS
jgi:hypothetical protein